MPYAYPHSFSERDKIRNDEKTESLKYNKKGENYEYWLCHFYGWYYAVFYIQFCVNSENYIIFTNMVKMKWLQCL